MIMGGSPDRRRPFRLVRLRSAWKRLRAHAFGPCRRSVWSHQAMLRRREDLAMRAMVLETPRSALVMRERETPAPAAGEILLAVAACGVCRTDLHVVDGELPHPRLPI